MRYVIKNSMKTVCSVKSVYYIDSSRGIWNKFSRYISFPSHVDHVIRATIYDISTMHMLQ